MKGVVWIENKLPKDIEQLVCSVFDELFCRWPIVVGGGICAVQRAVRVAVFTIPRFCADNTADDNAFYLQYNG